jgi:hypothetical protein
LAIGIAAAALAAATNLGARSSWADEPARADGEPRFERYRVVAGDTCWSIAKARLGDGERYRLIHQYNDLGPLPHKLKPGQILRLPIPGAAEPEAELTGTSGAVRARAPTTESWTSAAAGTDLFSLWRVNAQAKAWAEVTFRDRAQIQLREESVVIIYGRGGAPRGSHGQAQLESGALRARLGDLAGQGGGSAPPTLAVATPSAEADVAGAGTSTLFAVERGDATVISNHGTTAVTVRGRTKATAAAPAKPRKKVVSVGANMGTRAESGKDPEPPRPLPPAPRLRSGATIFVSDETGVGTVTAAWEPVAEAVRYRVELARLEAPTRPISADTFDKSVLSFRAEGLTPGEYLLAVAAIDGQGFESRPSAPLPLAVVTVRVLPAIPEQPAGHLRRLRVGDRIAAPPGLSCQLRAGTDTSSAEGVGRGPELVLASAGDQTLVCRDAAGRELAPVALRVEPLGVALTLAPGARAERGASVAVELTGPDAVLSRLMVTDAQGVPLGAAPTPLDAPSRPERRQLLVPIGADAPDRIEVAAQLEVGSTRLKVAELAIDVVAAVPAPAPTARSQRRLLLLIAGARPSADWTTGPDPAAGAVTAVGFIVGALEMPIRAGLAANLEVSVGRARLAGAVNASEIDEPTLVRIGAGVTWRPRRGDGTVAPLVLAGLSLDRLFIDGSDDHRVSLAAGGGLELSPASDSRSGIRLELRGRIAPEDLALAGEGLIGGFLRF